MSSTPMKNRKPLSHTEIHYLRAIQDLLDEPGYARNTDIAIATHRTRGSVTVALNRLKRDGLIEFDKNNFVKLTPTGRSLVTEYTGSKAVIYDFLKNILQLPEKKALEEACQLEDDLSRDTIHALLKLNIFIKERGTKIKDFVHDFDQYGNGLKDKTGCPSATTCFIHNIDTGHKYCSSGCFLKEIDG